VANARLCTQHRHRSIKNAEKKENGAARNWTLFFRAIKSVDGEKTEGENAAREKLKPRHHRAGGEKLGTGRKEITGKYR